MRAHTFGLAGSAVGGEVHTVSETSISCVCLRVLRHVVSSERSGDKQGSTAP